MHRALQLDERLKSALSRGLDEQGANLWGPLKVRRQYLCEPLIFNRFAHAAKIPPGAQNLDTDEELQNMDSEVVFFVPDIVGGIVVGDEVAIQQSLQALVDHCKPIIGSRHTLGDAAYIERLEQQITQYLDQRCCEPLRGNMLQPPFLFVPPLALTAVALCFALVP